MAEAIGRTTLSLSCQFTIDESEARALDALAGYGDDAFIKNFYEKLGKAYMEEHEQGLREFLKTIRTAVSPLIAHSDNIRKLLLEQAKKRQEQQRKDLAENPPL